MKTHVEWLTAEAAARHLGFVDAETGEVKSGAFYTFLCRERKNPNGIRAHRLRGRLRFRRVDLDSEVEAEPAALPTRLRVLKGGR